ncbi:MAG TPA: HAMP domain-containing sensor histidine kinase [Clostridia bacterium]|nr:HAMP domain-containing sensor histidine kinase [Clostridia bacterium]
MKLSRKLMLYFMAVAVLSLMLSAALTVFSVDRQFDNFLEEEHEKRVESIKESVDQAMSYEDNIIYIEGSGLERYAAIEGYYIEILSSEGKTVYRADGLNDMRSHMQGMMRRPFMEEQYNEESYELTADGSGVGTLVIGYFGHSNMSAAAATFKSAILRLGGFSVLIALIMGALLSRKLSRQIAKPVTQTTEMAKELAGGSYEFKRLPESKILEIEQLVRAVDCLKETLLRQETIRRRMAADMAHEIRTPIANLQAQIQALVDGLVEADDSLMESLYEETERLGFLVAGIEDINRLRTEAMTLNTEVADIGDETRKVIEAIGPSFEKKDLHSELNIKAPVLVSLDRQRYKQVMHNIYANSIKYAYEGTVIKTGISECKEEVVIEIFDEGLGIEKDELEKVFDYLYRSDDSRSRETGGYGIGLSVAKVIVEAHGGKIRAESEKNKWTRIVINLPSGK